MLKTVFAAPYFCGNHDKFFQDSLMNKKRLSNNSFVVHLKKEDINI